MARDLITELFDRFGKEENYGYKKFEIGVYLPNVIGFMRKRINSAIISIVFKRNMTC